MQCVYNSPMESQRWQEQWHGRVSTTEELVAFVDAVGCCSINALERFPAFPSVAVAMAKPDALWHCWWWKDDLHVQQRLYYTRLFAGRPSFISLKFLPAFIAVNGAAADELILLGRIPVETQRIYRLIEEHGPIASRQLKKLLPPEARKSATKALWELERRFIITKTEITGRQLATYSYVWDLAERWLPEAFTAADRLRAAAAKEQITAHLIACGVMPDPKMLTRVLRWE